MTNNTGSARTELITTGRCSDPLALCKITDREKMWIDDPSELYKNGNYTKFFPKYEMTQNQQLNAITRFAIYAFVLFWLFSRGVEWVYLAIILFIIILILYYVDRRGYISKKTELDKILNIRSQKILEQEKMREEEFKHDGEDNMASIQNANYQNINYVCPEEKKGYQVDAGYYDFSGDLITGPYQKRAEVGETQTNLFTIDELQDYSKNTCRKPTVDNPFMNPDILEFNNGDPPAACNAEDDDIKISIRENFNKGLFRNVDELWEIENSQRQFYTLPNTQVPNNQKDFAEWLYKIPLTCKQDQYECTGLTDLRFRSGPH